MPGSYLSTVNDIPSFGSFPVRESAGLVPVWGDEGYPTATDTSRQADFYREGAGESATLGIDSNGNAMLTVTLAPMSFTWYVVTAPGSTPAAPPVRPNRSPESVRLLAAVAMDSNRTASVEIPLSGVFSDPDGDALTYDGFSSSPSVVQAVVWGSSVWVTAVSGERRR